MEGIEGVVRVDAVTGKYDVVAEVTAEEAEELRDVVAGEIHAIDGVSDTATCIAT